MTEWTHNGLQQDLFNHLARPERMCWQNMPMGPAGSVRPDIYSMRKSFTDPRPLSYEIKVSLSDFRSDVTTGKWMSYLRFSCGVLFCLPKGLGITKADLPPGCGMMIRTDKVWRTAKGPTMKPIDELPLEVMLKLLINGVDRIRTPTETNELIHRHSMIAKNRKQLGKDVADALSNLDRFNERIERAKSRLQEMKNKESQVQQREIAFAQEEIGKANRLMDELGDILGCGHNHWTIKTRMDELRKHIFEDATNKRILSIVKLVHREFGDILEIRGS